MHSFVRFDLPAFPFFLEQLLSIIQYSFAVIPAMGELVTADRASYQYLVESIRRFPPAPAFARRIAAAGFSAVHHEPLTLGVVQVHSAVKL